MVKFTKYLCDPIILAAMLSALMLYSGTVKAKGSAEFSSLLQKDRIISISGTLCSDAVKKSGADFYKARLFSRTSRDAAGNSSTCRGCVEVYIPACMAEAYMPGKLYTEDSGKINFVCESGESIELYGKFSQNGVFYVDRGKRIAFDKKNKKQMQILSAILRLRSTCRMNFRRIMYSWNDAGGLFLALLSGIREYAEEDLCNAFRKSGLSHILALSGMHLSLFSTLIASIAGKFCSKKVTAAFQIVAVLTFVWFAGISPSLFRALLCSLICAFCSLAGLISIKMIKILALAFLIHITVRSQDIFDIAFMLSYGALSGILIFGEFATAIISRKIPFFISNAIGTSSGAQSFTAPVSISKTGAFAPAGIIASVIISPMISVFIYSGIILLIVCFIFPDFVPAAAFFMKILYTIIKRTVLIFSLIPNLTF
ncbi:MAG: ComEC/Rec2 family competence protein [Treponema sp.]|nr:ComEC/Rec2 family competence protein [Treponema sp.]